jgi:N-acylneuraminate-9-phosphatase
MLQLLLLDMDHTLCDTEKADAVGRRYLCRSFEEVVSLNSGEAEALSGHFMEILYHRPSAAEWQKKEGEQEGSYRGRLLQLCLSKKLGLKISSEICIQLVSDLMAKRIEAFDFFPGVPELLAELRQSYRTVVLTNGPLYSQEPKVLKVGMQDHVDRVVLAGAHPWSKPDPRIFKKVLDDEGCGPSEALHVGDSLGSDIAGAIASGIPSVWINPKGKSFPRELTPDYILALVTELPRVLKGLGG